LKLQHRIRNAIKGFNATTNSGNLREARQFLKYGNNQKMMPDWSQVVISDKDIYTGYMYGAINIRAVTVAQLATYNLKTKSNFKTADLAKQKDEQIVHPYLDLIDTSKTFSNYQFWYSNSVWVDLEGISYIMAIRNVQDGRVGRVQEFRLLNPYNIQRIFDAKTKDLIGYKEYKGGMSRDIPKEMIIPAVNLNPFTQDELFAMSDAAKDSQFTLKTANDYTRSAIRNNLNTPGIISTDRELEGEDAINFKARVMGNVKGEPIFAFGGGAMGWEDMQQDLNKAALKDVNSISLQNIIAASGASKTMLGWEESGTTRDTARVQKDNFIELRAMPNLQLIIDALNQDYKNYYQQDYERYSYSIYIENPLGVDIDEASKYVDKQQKKFELYESLVEKGYNREEVAKYIAGEIELKDMSEPKVVEQPEPEEEPEQSEQNKFLQQAETGIQQQAQASLQNSIVNIDNQLLMAVANKVGATKNDFEQEDDIITKKDRKEAERELNTALIAFYGIIIPLFAYNVLSKRLEETGLTGTFSVTPDVNRMIKNFASMASESHVSTLLESMTKQAQKDALAGLPRKQIADNLINKFGDEIAKSRAVAVARTETNRAFTMSQYSADKQFIKQNGLEQRAFKQWVTRSDNPCPFCQAMAEQPPIPFNEPFASVGDELTATADVDGKTVVRKMTMGYADAEAGNLHVNCGCEYELIIED
jgi:hypothetical protein